MTAETGAEGLDLVRRENPDVIVLDWQLPDRTGLEVFRELHTLAPKKCRSFSRKRAPGTTQTAIEAM